MSIAEATAAPRIHHQWLPDKVFYEQGVSQDSLFLLQSMGHQIAPKSRVLGSSQSIAVKGTNLEGSADPRRQGAAAVSQNRP